MVLDFLNRFFADGLGLLNIQPSHYLFALPGPAHEPGMLEKYLAEGVFPLVTDCAPALTYALLLGVLRYLLHHTLFKPLACWCMKLELRAFTRDPALDKAFPPKRKFAANKELVAAVHKYCADLHSESLLGYEASPSFLSTICTSLTTFFQSLHSSILFCISTILFYYSPVSPAAAGGAAERARTPQQVRSYLWSRRLHDSKEKKIVKFVEALWRLIFYFTFVCVGFSALFVPEPVSWVRDTMQHFEGWPYHPLTDIMRFYYMVELGAYFHQLMWTEVTRSDAAEMIAHHFITIALILFSFLNNNYRVGSVILFTHDLADIFLESAKVLNYTSKPKQHKWLRDYAVVDTVFGVFAVTFFFTRLVYYPRYLVHSVIYEGMYNHLTWNWAGSYGFVVFLCSLLGLHMFWFYLIVRMVIRLFTVGTDKDERSDDESENEELGDGANIEGLVGDGSATGAAAGESTEDESTSEWEIDLNQGKKEGEGEIEVESRGSRKSSSGSSSRVSDGVGDIERRDRKKWDRKTKRARKLRKAEALREWKKDADAQMIRGARGVCPDPILPPSTDAGDTDLYDDDIMCRDVLSDYEGAGGGEGVAEGGKLSAAMPMSDLSKTAAADDSTSNNLLHSTAAVSAVVPSGGDYRKRGNESNSNSNSNDETLAVTEIPREGGGGGGEGGARGALIKKKNN